MAEKPVRVQLRRLKGWRMPPNTVIVDRRSRWGNPYRVGDMDGNTYEDRTAEEAVALFRRSIKDWWGDDYTAAVQHLLRGKNLGCWCALDKPCHADVLLEIANQRTDMNQQPDKDGR